MAKSILIIDDEVLTLNNLKRVLEKEGYEVLLADSGETGVEIFARHRPNAALVDLMLPGIDGIEVLRKIRQIESNAMVIMITAYEIIEKAVQSMKLGAYDYLLKPFKMSDLRTTLAQALELQALRVRVFETIESEKGKYYFGRIIAKSKKMTDLLETARKIAGLEKTTVLITGESGVGKELLARAIHYNSPRADKPFIEINCASIPENLLESELLGYEPGAFTDARRRKIGRFENGDQGTVFLDEIADMSLPLQAKVLKVIEEQTFTRLGGTSPIEIDVRIISATNKELKKAMKEGDFREDLFYRLNVVPINIPPLRDRREDIIPLVLAFLEEFNHELHRAYRGVSEPAAKALREYNWPGNVRELRNVVERVMALHDVEEVSLEQLPSEIRLPETLVAAPVLKASLEKKQFFTLEEVEKTYIQEVLRSTGGNKSKAARILGIHPTSLFRKLRLGK